MELPACRILVASEFLGSNISLCPISICKLTPGEWADASCSEFQRRLWVSEKSLSSWRREQLVQEEDKISVVLRNGSYWIWRKQEDEMQRVYKEWKERLISGLKRDPGREKGVIKGKNTGLPLPFLVSRRSALSAILFMIIIWNI